MEIKENNGEEAATKLRQLLIADFGEKEIKMKITYENSIENRSENRQQMID